MVEVGVIFWRLIGICQFAKRMTSKSVLVSWLLLPQACQNTLSQRNNVSMADWLAGSPWNLHHILRATTLVQSYLITIQHSEPESTVKCQPHTLSVWQLLSPWHPQTCLWKEKGKVHVGIPVITWYMHSWKTLHPAKITGFMVEKSIRGRPLKIHVTL